MIQNTGQNVRTREDREQEIAILLCKARGSDPFQMTYQTVEPGVMEPYGEAWCHHLDEAKAVLDWHEAEQRRKDTEGRDTPSAYVRPDDFYNDERDERCGPWSGDQIGEYTLPLYTRPANVAALEAEIAELKKALRHVTWTASEYGLGKIGHESAVNRARAALTRKRDQS